MNIQKIMEAIPHRYPFLLVDRVLEINAKKSLKAIKNVTVNEAFFVGHFPQRPVMPGVLIVEALAQACGLLATYSYPDPSGNALFLLAGIEKTRFKRIVEPGDQLILHITMTSDKHRLLKCRGVATVNDEVACTTELSSVRREVTKND